MEPFIALWDDDLPEDDRYAELMNNFWESPEPEWLQCDKPEDEPSSKLIPVDDQEIPF